MPFTLSHAAAAVPFRRSRLVPSALAIGTFAPDLEYFIRLMPGGGWGHTIAGAFGLSLPLGLAALWVFHRLVKVPLAYLLPDGVRSRLTDQLAPFRFGPLRRLVHIVFSMLVGIATHLLWDGFTHPQYWIVRHSDFLRQMWKLPALGHYAVYAILQDVSSLVGLIVLMVWSALWLRKATPDPSIPRNPFSPAQRLVIAVAGVGAAGIGSLIRACIGAGLPSDHWEAGDFFEQVIVTFGALLWWQLAMWGVFGPFRHSGPKTPQASAYSQSHTSFEQP